jgi:hypothetical protein
MELWIILIIAVCVISAPVHVLLLGLMRKTGSPGAKMALLGAIGLESLAIAAILVWQFVLR